MTKPLDFTVSANNLIYSWQHWVCICGGNYRTYKWVSLTSGFVLAGRVNRFLHYFSTAELCFLHGENSPSPPSCVRGYGVWEEGTVSTSSTVLYQCEVLLMHYLDSVLIPVLSSVWRQTWQSCPIYHIFKRALFYFCFPQVSWSKTAFGSAIPGMDVCWSTMLSIWMLLLVAGSHGLHGVLNAFWAHRWAVVNISVCKSCKERG